MCSAHRILPASYTLKQEPVPVGTERCRGRFADVSNGEYLGSRVAIKRLNMDGEDTCKKFKVIITNSTHYHHSAITQRLCREIICWKYLSHPNILPLLGVSVSADLRCFRILTEWMPRGNLIEYTKVNTGANRLILVSLFAVSPPFSLSFTL